MNFEELVESKKSIGSMSKEELFIYCNGLLDEIWDFEKEIKRLKEEYMILQNASDEVEEKKDREIERLNGIIEIKTKRIQDLMRRLSKRQDRIDKAIEYIEEHKRTYENNEYSFDNMLEDVTPLLDILKGVDKE